VQTELQVPYRDTAADDLVWRLGEPRRPALATLELAVPGGCVELRLLGSSHQVILTARGTVVSEVVACADRPDADRNRLRFDRGIRRQPVPVALPATAERALPEWDYRFRSSTHRLAPDRFGYRVERLVDRLSDHPAAIVGRFPGSPHAVTALLAGAAGAGAVRWRTWHAYPEEGRLVATSTAVRPHSESAR
jgi:hypothetical protein